MTWEPILGGALADKARAALADIAGELPPPELGAADAEALFWGHAGRLLGAVADRRCEAAIDALLGRIEQGHGDHLALHGGLSGAAFALAHLAGDDIDDLLAALDAPITGALAAGGWAGDFDLIGGLTGIGVYLLERCDTSALEHVVRQLDALAEESDEGLTWHTQPELLPRWQREQWPRGYHNLGVAHGVPGVIAFLGRASALPEPPTGARALCAGGLAWMRAQRQSHGGFPASIAPGEPEPAPARAAWCYGDPGISAALWSAAARCGVPTDEWRALAATCATRAVERCGVEDAGLCHGAIGLAHLFNRFYQASRDPLFLEASLTWFERGLAMRRPGAGIGGFLTRAWDPDTGEWRWEPAAGLLEGAAGIGLALLAALGDEEPGWDRLLLCDIPPTGGTHHEEQARASETTARECARASEGPPAG